MRNTFRLFQGNILSDIAIMIDMLRSDFSVRKVHEVLINFRFPNVDTKPHEDKSVDDEASTCPCLDVREL